MEEKKRKIIEEEDFIDYPKFKNSIKKVLEKYPDGIDSNEIIAKCLNLSPEEVEHKFQNAIKKIQKKLKI